MPYYLIEAIDTSSKKKKILIYIIVAVAVMGATILGIHFAQYSRANKFAKSLEQNKKDIQMALEKEEEEKRIVREEKIIAQGNAPRVPQFTEKAKEDFGNIYTSEDKIAYLTFDDGPSNLITPIILDVLKENDIQATFFLLGNRIKANASIVKRTYEEGHYIANHGYSHVYKDIYVSPEAVLEEYNKTEETIRVALEVPEYSSHLFRFPGGSVGGKYTRVKNDAKQLLYDNGIVYLDWNSLTGDSEGKLTKEAMLAHLDGTSEGKGNVLVVLMHDSSDKILTAEILQDAINLLRGKGYEFRNLYSIME